MTRDEILQTIRVHVEQAIQEARGSGRVFWYDVGEHDRCTGHRNVRMREAPVKADFDIVLRQVITLTNESKFGARLPITTGDTFAFRLQQIAHAIVNAAAQLPKQSRVAHIAVDEKEIGVTVGMLNGGV